MLELSSGLRSADPQDVFEVEIAPEQAGTIARVLARNGAREVSRCVSGSERLLLRVLPKGAPAA